MSNQLCPFCSEPIEYWQSHCRNGDFVGYPNRRAAEAERDELEQRYRKARDTAADVAGEKSVAELEALAKLCSPVINMPSKVCYDLLQFQKYRSYHQRVASFERDPAEQIPASDRLLVEVKLFPHYGENILYAALSPSGRGLPGYGAVAVS